MIKGLSEFIEPFDVDAFVGYVRHLSRPNNYRFDTSFIEVA